MKEISLEVRDEYIVGDGVPCGSVGSYDSTVLKVHFNKSWDDTAKTAMFLNARRLDPTYVVMTPLMEEDGTYTLPVPVEATAYAGDCILTFKGIKTNTDTTTEGTLTAYGTFQVLESLWDSNGEAAGQPTASIATQLQTEIDYIKDNIQAAIDSAEAAAESAEEAEDSAEAAATSETNAGTSATNAGNSATAAGNSATAAAASKLDSEAYAIGKRNGVDVPSTDPAYHNNAKYYAEHMQSPVTSVFGRTGAVTAQNGDYDATMIPYESGSQSSVKGVLLTKEDASNKVTTLTVASTHDQYPSAKCTFNYLVGKQEKAYLVTSISASSDDTHYPSAKAVYDLFNSMINAEEVGY